ncbi:hypothetical protein M3Y99_00902800 [Aphelenchoides fujianensis]|nr:hypothetical protein M3Y99_00902800 [Aphelenchoides fujianensis]
MKKADGKSSPKAAEKATDCPLKSVRIQTPEAEKKADGPKEPKAVEIQPPTPQTPKRSWRKAEPRSERPQPELFGYAPFQAPPLAAYDPRVHAALNGSSTSFLFCVDRKIAATYSIPRPESTHPPAFVERPPSNAGLYRQHSFNSQFAAPVDRLDAESLYGARPDIFGATIERPGSRLSRASFAAGGLVQDVKFRRASAMSGFVCAEMPPVYGAHEAREAPRGKEIICGTCIFVMGIARMFLRSDYAKGQELFYGMSAVVAGLLGHLAARHRNHCLAVAAFVHSLINALLAFIPLVSALLPVLPLLQARSNGSFLSLGDPVEYLEADFVLAVFSIVQFGVALFVAIYGCRTAGAALHHFEELRFPREVGAEKGGF